MTIPIQIPIGAPFLEAEDIRVEFGGKVAVGGISMTVKGGEVVAIIGPSGSGKSTFLRCINHLQAPTSGTVRVGGVSIVDRAGQHPSAKELAQLRRRVGMVFQSFNLFPHLTALENVTLAQIYARGRNKADAELRGKRLLDRVGLSDRADHRPGQLSGGQQQRVAIARALALEPQVMLFDEPTSALDPELGGEVLKVMRDMADDGMTMMIVTHEMQFAKDVADRVVFISDGVIVVEGAPADVLERPTHARTQRFLEAVLNR